MCRRRLLLAVPRFDLLQIATPKAPVPLVLVYPSSRGGVSHSRVPGMEVVTIARLAELVAGPALGRRAAGDEAGRGGCGGRALADRPGRFADMTEHPRRCARLRMRTPSCET